VEGVSSVTDEQSKIDVTVPHSARIWNYWLGGKDNFAVDREAGDQYVQFFPGIVDIARADRAFLCRAVRHLVGSIGIRQLLDVGTACPPPTTPTRLPSGSRLNPASSMWTMTRSCSRTPVRF
jgi:S-adenosyl methyltransferase